MWSGVERLYTPYPQNQPENNPNTPKHVTTVPHKLPTKVPHKPPNIFRPLDDGFSPPSYLTFPPTPRGLRLRVWYQYCGQACIIHDVKATRLAIKPPSPRLDSRLKSENGQ